MQATPKHRPPGQVASYAATLPANKVPTMTTSKRSPSASRSTAGATDPSKRTGEAAPPHKWAFRALFKKHAFGWRSQPAIQRIKEAVSEIKKVARTDPVHAADGAVLFIEKLSPALEHVDGSSGAIGTAVNNAIAALASIIAAAPADEATRQRWLERLNAYTHTMQAGENAGCTDDTRQRIRALVAAEGAGDRLVTKVLGRQLGLS
jgi:hypothetical protein